MDQIYNHMIHRLENYKVSIVKHGLQIFIGSTLKLKFYFQINSCIITVNYDNKFFQQLIATLMFPKQKMLKNE